MVNNDNVKIAKLINKCVHLKFLFCGVFPADSFSKLFADSFIVVNASDAGTIGTHCLLVCKKNDKIYFADPLGNSLEIYLSCDKINFFGGMQTQN